MSYSNAPLPAGWVQDASRLIYAGFSRQSEALIKEMRDLLMRYMSDDRFRELVQEVALGLQLEVLDASTRDGILLAPLAGSRFAYNWSDLGKRIATDTSRQAMFILAFAATITAFYPTAAALDESVVASLDRNLSVRDIVDQFKRLSEQVILEQTDERLLSGYRQAAEEALKLPEVRDTERSSKSSLSGLVQSALKLMVDQRLIYEEKVGGENRYTPLRAMKIYLAGRQRGGIVDVMARLSEQALEPGTEQAQQEVTAPETGPETQPAAETETLASRAAETDTETATETDAESEQGQENTADGELS